MSNNVIRSIQKILKDIRFILPSYFIMYLSIISLQAIYYKDTTYIVYREISLSLFFLSFIYIFISMFNFILKKNSSYKSIIKCFIISFVVLLIWFVVLMVGISIVALYSGELH